MFMPLILFLGLVVTLVAALRPFRPFPHRESAIAAAFALFVGLGFAAPISEPKDEISYIYHQVQMQKCRDVKPADETAFLDEDDACAVDLETVASWVR
jgi:hypothetical protein